eukprot:3685309-Amphidinium_carterae.1
MPPMQSLQRTSAVPALQPMRPSMSKRRRIALATVSTTNHKQLKQTQPKASQGTHWAQVA